MTHFMGTQFRPSRTMQHVLKLEIRAHQAALVAAAHLPESRQRRPSQGLNLQSLGLWECRDLFLLPAVWTSRWPQHLRRVLHHHRNI